MTQLTLTGVGVTLHRRQLLADVSLAWPEAKLGGIIGPNGAGKSTLLKAINRMLPHSGAIAYRERTLDPKTSRIAYVPQLNRSESALTAFDMVLLGKVRQLGWRVSARPTRSNRRWRNAAFPRLPIALSTASAAGSGSW